MPIKISNELPARKVLENEHIFVMTETRALSQDIRPLKILILNLMPNKIETETQLLRCLSNTPLQIEITLMQMQSHLSKNTSREHLLAFYTTFEQICRNRYDGMIITGAPVEKLAFEQVGYWPELCKIMEWSKTHVFSTLHICWGAQAGLYYHYGIQKKLLPQKLSGVFKVDLLTEKSRLFHGMDSFLYVPQSRHTESDRAQVAAHPDLRIMSESAEVGLHLVGDRNGRQFFVMGHHEYDRNTIANEYYRDLQKGLNPEIPQNYFKNNNPQSGICASWHIYASVLFTNWLNYFVYQTTPYELQNLSGK